MQSLRLVADNLAAAIDWTLRCEAERRTILFEQRVANNLYRRACEKTRRLLTGYLGDIPAVLAS
ncbi:MAG: hypothetical protein HC822_02910 [Oscillochloris sp.]|nr:hypothetical protein [Oscillochloris sp.]